MHGVERAYFEHFGDFWMSHGTLEQMSLKLLLGNFVLRIVGTGLIAI
jgi:hypothetical protein